MPIFKMITRTQQAEKIRQKKRERVKEEQIKNVPPAPPQEHENPASLKAKLDELADEIDDLLEENAEQFVTNYVQRGGE